MMFFLPVCTFTLPPQQQHDSRQFTSCVLAGGMTLELRAQSSVIKENFVLMHHAYDFTLDCLTSLSTSLLTFITVKLCAVNCKVCSCYKMAASPCGEKVRRLRDCVDIELGRAQLCLCQGGERGGGLCRNK